jgi:hypothetical protein
VTPGVQVPLVQISLPLHASPSEHELPLGSDEFTHPDSGSQESAVQALLSLQVRSVPAWQTPTMHFSSPLQALPSLHSTLPLIPAPAAQAQPLGLVHSKVTLMQLSPHGLPAEQTLQQTAVF